MLLYDNLEDAQGKLLNTICSYAGQAVYVREVRYQENSDKPPYRVALMLKGVKNVLWINLDDPKFSFRDFNIGYSNHGGTAAWWYRKPLKQYRQGLRADQMNHLCAKPEFNGYAKWDYHKPIIEMLENKYPSMDTCKKALVDGEEVVSAFHKDLAMSYDRIHKDFILEYHGKLIGQTSTFKNFELLDEYKYLTETIKEAIG